MHGEDSAPNLLPPRPRVIVDRGPQVEAFDQALTEASTQGQSLFFGLTGPPGIGKTTLGLHLSYRAADDFPDAQLYADLGGSTPAGPTEPGEVLKHFLVQLKVQTDRIPAGEADRAAVFRSETARKRFVLLLDDAASAAQLRPFLPSSPHCVVVVTSRTKLTAVRQHGFRLAELEPFTRDFAIELITQSVDSARLDAEPDARDQLLALCGGVPLALSVVAATLNAPTGRLARLVKKTLAGSPSTAYVDDEMKSIGAVLTLSYEELTAGEARAFRLLGLHPGAEFDLGVVAALLGTDDDDDALDLLDGLVEANLLQVLAPERFRFHELVRRHAHDRGVDEMLESDVADAQRLIVTCYLHRVIAQVKALYRRWWVADLFEQIAASDSADALTELETERLNLLAAILLAEELEFDEILPPFCEAVGPWYYNTGRVTDLLMTQEIGVTAAVNINDRAAEMRLRNQWGTGLELAGNFEAAVEQFTLSLQLAQALSHVLGEQSALDWIGIVRGAQGQLAEAIDALRQSQQVAERIADPEQRARAIMLSQMHIERLLAGAEQSAGDATLRSVLKYFHDNNEPVNEARTFVSLAGLCPEEDLQQALPMLERAAELFKSQKFVVQQVDALGKLAEIEDRLGQHESAAERRREAEELTTPER